MLNNVAGSLFVHIFLLFLNLCLSMSYFRVIDINFFVPLEKKLAHAGNSCDPNASQASDISLF